MDLERISDVLQNYNGHEESMQQVAAVLQEELGENWTQTVFQDLQSLSPALKENLTHAFNYYAATMAWNEVQTYLNDSQLARTPEIEERLPILKHWLDFFGAPGVEAYQSLEDRLNGAAPPNTTPDDAGDNDAAEAGEVTESVPQETEDDTKESDETSQETSAEQTIEVTDAESETSDENNHATAQTETADEGKFVLDKIKHQLALLDQNQAWLAARCVQLKNIEIYAYPFYGFMVDLLRQVLKDMNEILEDEKKAALLDNQFDGGKEAFVRRKEAVEHDIELAEQNCESAVTALISDDVDMEEIKRTLGTIDDSDTVEYVGPAPDGFELVDDESPLDENAIKKQYEKVEQMDIFGSNQTPNEEKNDQTQENTSQNAQKGVQRKLSFSLKREKPTGDAT